MPLSHPGKEATAVPRMAMKALRMAFVALLALVLAAIFYVLAVMLSPQTKQSDAPSSPQMLLTASPARVIDREDGLETLLQSFPVQALSCVPGSGCTLLRGRSYDTAFEDGFARVVALEYASPLGVRFTVCSVYPARALALMGRDGYTLAPQEGPLVAGMRTVRMEKSGSVRLHAQTEQALYYITAPSATNEALGEMLRSLQLLSAGKW